MTRAKKIGYTHAALSTVWVSTLVSDLSHAVNGVLGDTGCIMITWCLALPLTWLAAMMTGVLSLFHNMTALLIQMILMGVAIVLNGLLVGTIIDRILTRMGIPARRNGAQLRKNHKQVSAGK